MGPIFITLLVACHGATFSRQSQHPAIPRLQPATPQDAPIPPPTFPPAFQPTIPFQSNPTPPSQVPVLPPTPLQSNPTPPGWDEIPSGGQGDFWAPPGQPGVSTSGPFKWPRVQPPPPTTVKPEDIPTGEDLLAQQVRISNSQINLGILKSHLREKEHEIEQLNTEIKDIHNDIQKESSAMGQIDQTYNHIRQMSDQTDILWKMWRGLLINTTKHLGKIVHDNKVVEESFVEMDKVTKSLENQLPQLKDETGMRELN